MAMDSIEHKDAFAITTVKELEALYGDPHDPAL